MTTKTPGNERNQRMGINNFLVRLKAEKVLHLMILPTILVTIFFSYFPMYGIIIAFKKYTVIKGIFNSPWASHNGFENFIDLFTAPSFKLVLTNTIFIAIAKLALLSLPPAIFAILLNEVKNKHFLKINQSISYFPHFISWVIIGGMVYNMLDVRGPVNTLLLNLRLLDEPFNFMASPEAFVPLVIFTEFWKEIGWNSIIYIAVIASIDPTLYEALEIDGGGRLAKAFYITWPALKGVFMILFILSCGSIMSGTGSTFEQSYIMGNPMNRDTSDVLETYILRLGLREARYSLSTAAGLFKSVINVGLLFGANKFSKIITEKSLF